ncbi:hypothetical protein JTB14_015052 [Gonioctena quinquepunctata]|nr:hypothetical protein JTB14_015052 [Gonioctena quinquepunctata]
MGKLCIRVMVQSIPHESGAKYPGEFSLSSFIVSRGCQGCIRGPQALGGERIPHFKDNLPGEKWVEAFLKRHKDLTVRFATNIERSRAALNGQQMQDFIENLKQTFEGVPPHAIFNYDKTNSTDNPGQKKVLTKRGMKYPEIVNSSKSCISLMFAGNAAACEDHDVQVVCLPPNSTLVTQPLDVAFFAPLKKAWREILSDYTESHVGSRSSGLEKQHFPTLLRRLMEKISENGASNSIAGFRKCGIVPCDVGPLLERLHNNHNSVVNQENIHAIENSFLRPLENKRGKEEENNNSSRKKHCLQQNRFADLPGTPGIVRAPISKHSKEQRANEVSKGDESDKLSETWRFR